MHVGLPCDPFYAGKIFIAATVRSSALPFAVLLYGLGKYPSGQLACRNACEFCRGAFLQQLTQPSAVDVAICGGGIDLSAGLIFKDGAGRLSAGLE